MTRKLQRGSKEPQATWLEHVRADWAAADLVEPPVWVANRARRLFRDQVRPVPAPGPGILERFTAALVFDSRRRGLAPSAAGTRSSPALGSARPTSWQLLYRAADVDVDLLVRSSPDGRTVTIRGQALAAAGPQVRDGDVTAILARVGAPPETAARASLQAAGEFVLAGLSRGHYDLLLRLGPREIKLADVEL